MSNQGPSPDPIPQDPYEILVMPEQGYVLYRTRDNATIGIFEDRPLADYAKFCFDRLVLCEFKGTGGGCSIPANHQILYGDGSPPSHACDQHVSVIHHEESRVLDFTQPALRDCEETPRG